MKRRFQKQQGLTIVEVLVAIIVLFILAWMLLPYLARPKRHSINSYCIMNLDQINLAFRIWEGDNNNRYPMQLSVTNDGAMEWIATNNVAACLRLMSNELSTTKILVCPADKYRVAATNFDDFNNSQISYFVGVDANEAYPQRLLLGDDNFQMNGATVPSGVFQFPTNAPVSWTAARHKFVGNIGYADGSVAELSSAQLREAFLQSDLATNRLAIP